MERLLFSFGPMGAPRPWMERSRMLIEWLQYLATPCPRHLRAMGYPQEIIATQARYRRCKEAWRPHLENTKAFILESAAAAMGNRTAVVLGSGMLLDVPLDELSQRFEQVILVDILHLPWVKRRGLRYPNVRFQELDVTGVCELLFDRIKQVRSGQGVLPTLSHVLPEPLAQSLGVSSIDFLASVNLLSQLPILPCAYLEKNDPPCSEQDLSAFSKMLIANHLRWIKAGSEHTCLITDLERMRNSVTSEESERENAVCDVKLPLPGKHWMWEIALRPEVRPGHDLRHRVGGYVL